METGYSLYAVSLWKNNKKNLGKHASFNLGLGNIVFLCKHCFNYQIFALLTCVSNLKTVWVGAGCLAVAVPILAQLEVFFRSDYL